MSNLDRKIVKEKIKTWQYYELELSVPALIEKLQNLVEVNPLYFDFKLSPTTHTGYYNDVDIYVDIFASRWETDVEVEDRIERAKRDKVTRKKREAELAAKKEEEDRKLYEKLKKKFDDEINNGK